MKNQQTPPSLVVVRAKPAVSPYEQGQADERARIIQLLQKFEDNSNAYGLTRSARIATDLAALIGLVK